MRRPVSGKIARRGSVRRKSSFKSEAGEKVGATESPKKLNETLLANRLTPKLVKKKKNAVPNSKHRAAEIGEGKKL